MTDLNKLMHIYSNDRPLLGALQELQQRRESELRPAAKFLNNDIHQQVGHLLTEFNEMMAEYSVANYELMINELVDMQMSVETALTVLGLNRQQRMESRRKVIEKNAKRGYYEPQQGSK